MCGVKSGNEATVGGVEPGNEATVCVEWSLGTRLQCVWSGAWK